MARTKNIFCVSCELLVEYCGSLNENGLCEPCEDISEHSKVDTQDDVELATSSIRFTNYQLKPWRRSGYNG